MLTKSGTHFVAGVYLHTCLFVPRAGYVEVVGRAAYRGFRTFVRTKSLTRAQLEQA